MSSVKGGWLQFMLMSLLLLVGCGGSGPAEGETLTVFAAASLVEAFTEMAAAFEQENPGVAVRLNVAGSQQLAQQLAQGAPADLFASADRRQMEAAIAAGRVESRTPRRFAATRMALIVPAGNPAAIDGLADLNRPGVKLVLAGEQVPAGRYARQVLDRAADHPAFSATFRRETLANVVSHEQNVRAVLTKVELGEADAGIVYAGDTQGAEVETIAIEDDLNVQAGYLLAPIADSDRPELARAFFDLALSAQGREILAKHGLQPALEP